jgi:hypothetical protein
MLDTIQEKLSLTPTKSEECTILREEREKEREEYTRNTHNPGTLDPILDPTSID